MRISELKKEALSSLKGKWGLAVGLMILYFFLNFVIVTVGDIILLGGVDNWTAYNNSDTDFSLTVTIFEVAVSIALIPFSVGVYWLFLDVFRKEDVTIGNAFTLYKNSDGAFKVILGSIVQGIFVFLWTLLFIIPGIIKSFSYSQMFYLLKDHPEYGVLEAITESRKRMDGLKWKLFLVNLSFIGWGILALFTFGIGFLWLIPYISTTLAAFYNEHIADK